MYVEICDIYKSFIDRLLSSFHYIEQQIRVEISNKNGHLSLETIINDDFLFFFENS